MAGQAQPPGQAQLPGQGYTASTGNTPTAEQTGPYTPVPIPESLGGLEVPQSTTKSVTPAQKLTKAQQAQDSQEVLMALASWLGLETPEPGLAPITPQNLAPKPGSGPLTAPKLDVPTLVDALAKHFKIPTGPPPKGKKTFTSGGKGRPPVTTTAEVIGGNAPSQDQILSLVAKQVGAKGNSLTDIAQAIPGVKIPAGALGTLGGAESITSIKGATAAEMYAQFVKTGFDPKTGAPNAKVGIPAEQALVKAGYLDVNTSGGTPTANDIQSAYISMLSTAIHGNPAEGIPAGAGIAVALAKGTAAAQQIQAGAPSSEAYAYTQGIAAEYGVALRPDQVNAIINDPKIAAEITSTGNPGNVADEIKNLVIAQYDPNANNPPGVANSMFMGIQTAAIDYQIPLAPDQISSMVKSGLETASVAYPASAVNDVIDKAKQQLQSAAAGLYPTLATQIKGGQKVTDLMQPYLSVAAAYTGKPAADMLNAQGPTDKGTGLGASATSAIPNQWTRFLDGGPKDPKTGAPTQMTMDQWKRTLMSDPQYGFQNTQGGKNMASQLTAAILNEFGLVNTGANMPTASSLNEALGANT